MKRLLSLFLATAFILGGCAGDVVLQNPVESLGKQTSEEIQEAPTDEISIEIYEEFYDGALKTIHYGKLFGVIDADGNIILDCIYDDIRVISPSRITASQNNGGNSSENRISWIYDDKGNVISDGEWRMIAFSHAGDNVYSSFGIGEHYIPDGDVGAFLIDHDGNKVLSTRFDYIHDTLSNFSEYLIVSKDEKEYVINIEGNLLDESVDNFLASYKDRKQIIKETSDNLLLNGFSRVKIISENRLIAHKITEYDSDEDAWMYAEAWIFDAEGNVISSGEWRDIRFGTNDGGIRDTIGIGIIYIPDREDGYGEFLINQDGEKVTSTRYDYITMAGLYNIFVVTLDGERFAVDGNGNRVDIEFD
ncbi:MAG: WG repeat-containing protein [Oscillospiraceae bacterium]|nr:WG repeat-containing protein [Oscillospiraceae bacterium]